MFLYLPDHSPGSGGVPSGREDSGLEAGLQGAVSLEGRQGQTGLLARELEP